MGDATTTILLPDQTHFNLDNRMGYGNDTADEFSSQLSPLPGIGIALELCSQNNRSVPHDPDIEAVKYITYGILLPAICALGIVGNVLNLIVLNQPNMKGTAYIYMKGMLIGKIKLKAQMVPPKETVEKAKLEHETMSESPMLNEFLQSKWNLFHSQGIIVSGGECGSSSDSLCSRVSLSLGADSSSGSCSMR